jgi:hypothetical protein
METDMLKTALLMLALTVTLANGAFAAPKQQAWPADGYNSTVPYETNDGRLFDRAKGSID